MLSGTYCPACLKLNACSCDTCIRFIKEQDVTSDFTENGEGLICGHCGNIYSFDQALDTEYKMQQDER